MKLAQLQDQEVASMDVDLILNSPGKSIAGLVNTLLPALQTDVKSTAAKVFNTPSILIENLDRVKAEQIKQLLEETGARLSISPRGTFSEEVKATYETALVIRDVRQVPAIIQQVALLLRLPIAEAQKLLFRSPTLILGNVSKSSAEALKEGFQEYNADILISDTQHAAYDLYLSGDAAHLRNDLLNWLQRRNIRRTENSDSLNQPLIATELNQSQALSLWEQFSVAGESIKIVNRDFYTFDLRWQSAYEGVPLEPIAEYLNQSFGIPKKAYDSIHAHTGVIIEQYLSFQEIENHLAALTQLGATCLADLTTLQSYTCLLKNMGNTEPSMQAIELITGLNEKSIKEALRSPSKKLFHTRSKLQASWLRHAIQQNGGTLEIKTDS